MAEEKQCVICLEGSADYTLECQHTFHRPCIREWFETRIQQGISMSCPTCRRQSSLPTPGQLSHTQMRKLITDGILSIPQILEILFANRSDGSIRNFNIRLQRVYQKLTPHIQQFHANSSYTLTRFITVMLTGIAFDYLLWPDMIRL